MHSAIGALPPARTVLVRSRSSSGSRRRRSICSYNSPSQRPATPGRIISSSIIIGSTPAATAIATRHSTTTSNSSRSKRRGLISVLPRPTSFSSSHSLPNAADSLIAVCAFAYPPPECASSSCSSHGQRRWAAAAISAFPAGNSSTVNVPDKESVIHQRSRTAVLTRSRIYSSGQSHRHLRCKSVVVGQQEKGKKGSFISLCCYHCSKAPGDYSWGRGMELFRPQLVVASHPFRFQSEYHMTTRATMKDSRNPVCFFGLGAKSPVKEIVQAGDPVLHEPAQEVRPEEIGSARIGKIINDMVATMRNAPGVGLAAPQIGIQLQIIVLEDTKELMSYTSVEECEAQERYPFDLLVIINPKLKTKSGSGRAVFFEGCLSVDGYRALVERDLEVEVTGLGRDGLPISVEAKGWKARILQHECDHLLGDLYVDKMVSRTFRTKENLRLPLPSGCPKPGVVACQH